MSESPFESMAYAMVKKGYRIFPIAPGEKFPARFEDGQWWPMNDWNDVYSNRPPTKIELDFWRLYYPKDAGIGLLLGEGSGLIALDFDYDLNDIHSKILDTIPESPVKKAGQKGFTAFYRYNGETSRSWQMKNQAGKSCEVLALLSNGRQTVLPPTRHPAGMSYEWEPPYSLEVYPFEDIPMLPDGFEKAMDRLFGHTNHTGHEKSELAKLADCQYGPTSLAKAQKALEFISPDSGYQEWIEIGMALKDYFGDTGFELWDAWSSGGAKYKRREIIKKWASFRGHGVSIASLFRHAQDSGFINIPEIEPELCFSGNLVLGGNLSALPPTLRTTTPNLLPHLEPESPVIPRVDPTLKPAPQDDQRESWEKPKEEIQQEEFTWPDHEPGSKKYLFNEAPGLVGKIARWMTSTAIYPDPILNLACAISLVAVLKAHRYQTDSGLRTNIYTMGIAPSGTGKDHARKCVSKLLKAIGQSILLSGQPASSSGLFAAVYKANGRTLILADEFGKVLSGMSGSNASQHTAGIPTLLMEFFSSSSSNFLGAEYANRDGKNPRNDIEQPCLSMYATTTPEPLYSALSSVQAIDGFLSRWLLFQTTDFPVIPKKVSPLTDPPANIIHELKLLQQAATNIAPAGNLDQTIKPKVIKYTAQAEKMAYAFMVAMRQRAKDHLDRDTGFHAIFTRTAEHAAKLALVAFEGSFIDESVYAWASEMAMDRSLFLIGAVSANVADSKYEADLKRVLRAIEKCGSRGITISELTKKTTTLRAKDRAEIIQTLGSMNLIETAIIDLGTQKLSTGYKRVFGDIL